MRATSPDSMFAKVRHALRLDALSPGARRIIVSIVGGIVLLAGLAMVVLPGPAFVVIPLGLAILASEFEWARRYMKKARDLFRKMRKKKK
jgi:hypothetical protein